MSLYKGEQMNLKNILRVLRILSTSMSFLLFSFAQAATYYVSTSGSDSNAGTLAKPFKTIQRGLDLARAGDTVMVRGGTYAGSVTFRYSGASGRPITLQNYNGEKAIIDQGYSYTLKRDSNNVRRVTFNSLAGSTKPIGWIVIDGMEIMRGWDGIKFNNAYDVIIRGCNIHHNLSQGLVGNGLRITLDRNIVANNSNAKWRGYPSTTNQLHGIYLSGTSHKIINNVIHSNLCHGIQAAGLSAQPEHYSSEYGGARNWLVANNTFAYQKNCAAMTVYRQYAQNMTIMNNIFYENSKDIPGPNGISFYNSGSGHLVKNNLFYSSKNYAPIYTNVGIVYSLSANLMQTKPLFVSASGFNFRQLSSSPSINKGLKTTLIPWDFDKKTRPRGTTHDIGAFEY